MPSSGQRSVPAEDADSTDAQDLTVRPEPLDGVPLSLDPHAGMEIIAARGWQGIEQERLGDWVLRTGHRFTGRANSALAIGDPGVPMAAAVDAVADWYAARGMPPLVQLAVPPAAAAADAFIAAGWTETNAALVMTARLPAVLTACRPDSDSAPVHINAAPTAGWLSGYQYRGSALPAGAAEVLVSAAADTVLGFAEVSLDGEVVAVARGAVNDGWLGVTAVTVDERYRRRGLGTLLMYELARWAQPRATSIYLQVSPDNGVAIAMYRRIGFGTLHRYHYRTAPYAG